MADRGAKRGRRVAAAALLGAGGLLYAREIETRRVEVRSLELTLPRLAPEFDGFRRLILPPFSQRYTRGLHVVRGMFQYTNRGIGFVHARLRFLCRPEITVFTLRSPAEPYSASRNDRSLITPRNHLRAAPGTKS